MNEDIPKKRNRIAASCYNCRKKKTRCDRSRPFCSRCLIDKCTDQCKYDGPSNPSPGTIVHDTLELTMLKKRIQELEKIVNHQQNIINNTPPSSETLPSELNGSRLLDDVNYTLTTSNMADKDPTANNEEGVSNGNYSFNGYAVLQSNLLYLEPTSYTAFVLKDANAIDIFANYMQGSKNGLENCYSEADASPVNLNELGELPNIKDINFLINSIFQKFNIYLLFFDKEIIASQLYDLLEDKVEYSVIKPIKSNKSTLVGILLILIKFSYDKLNDQEISLLTSTNSKFVINEAYIDIASGLLTNLNSYKNVTLLKVQGLLLLRLYKMHCFEDDDSSYQPSVLNALIIQTARILGINQHPSRFPGQYLTSKEINNWKINWNFICYFDLTYAFDKGILSIIRPGEISNSNYEIDLNFHNPSIIRIFELQHEISKILIKFLLGSINKRIVNKKEIGEFLNNSSNLLVNKIRNFDQLIIKGNKFDFIPDITERSKEFLIRLDLYYKELSLCIILSSEANESKQDRSNYLSMALERMLIIFRIGYKFIVEKQSFFNQDLDKFIATRIWAIIKMVNVGVNLIILKFFNNEISINDAIKHFTLIDAIDIMQWINFNHQNEILTIKNIIFKLIELYSYGSSNASMVYSIFKCCVFFKFSFDYLKQKIPDLFEFNDDINVQKLNIENYGWQNSLEFPQVMELWNRKFDVSMALNVEYLFSGLNTNLDSLFSLDNFPDFNDMGALN